MLSAIIVAAGSSRRVGFDKLTAQVAGKPVIEHTLDAFNGSEAVADIVLVTQKERLGEFEKLAGKYGKLREIIVGGQQRQDSVRVGLEHVCPQTTYVSVHDAGRPLVTPEQIRRVFVAAQEHGAAALAELVSDTLKRADKNLMVSGSVDRQQLYVMQTPQIFERKLLEQAYRAVFTDKLYVTDEVSAVEPLGHAVALVPASDFNLKITYQRDLRLVDMILRERATSAPS